METNSRRVDNKTKNRENASPLTHEPGNHFPLQKFELQRLLFCLVICLVCYIQSSCPKTFISLIKLLSYSFTLADFALYQKQNSRSELTQILFCPNPKPICISVFISFLSGKKYLSKTSPFNSALNPYLFYLYNFFSSIIFSLSLLYLKAFFSWLLPLSSA